MATFTKYEHFIEAVFNSEIDAFGTTNTFRAALHSDAPVVATDDELADLTQPTGTGYTAGGEDMQNDATRSGGTVTFTAIDITWTASAGDWTAFRYVSQHDDTSITDILMNYYDYGSNITLGNGETFTVDYGANVFTAS